MPYKNKGNILSQTATSMRIIVVSMVICCLVYGSAVLLFARIAEPEKAEGSLVRDPGGKVLGSRLIAQGFSNDKYLWPRPSAVDYNASASGGSNLSPANPELSHRAEKIIDRYNLRNPVTVPLDLVTASGSGLDPHITLRAALAQAERIAAARGLSASSVDELLKDNSVRTGGFLSPEPLVNVFEINLALDRMCERHE
jgi:potassium-transporting ATPase KdpC subunit